jgi:YfiH family protein
VHGFGRAGFGEADFAADPRFLDFRPVVMRQIHSDRVHRVTGPPEGRPEGDALVTNRPGLLLVVRTADCLPVFLVDGSRRAVAAVHCGWRGTRARILEKAVRTMESAFGTKTADLAAALGPCIAPCCYEVGPEVRDGFIKAGFPLSVFLLADEPSGASCAEKPGRREGSLLDLRAANAWLLESLGVPGAAVAGDIVCTHCDAGFYSYRREPGEKRRLYNFIGIRPE